MFKSCCIWDRIISTGARGSLFQGLSNRKLVRQIRSRRRRASEEELMVDNLEKQTPGPLPTKLPRCHGNTFERY
jgi:hypothetical protein